MRTASEILELLDELAHRPAHELEDQDLDFKVWPARGIEKAVSLVVEMAICMANGGGGTVVFGVADKVVGRDKAILGVPPEIDVNRLKKAVYDSTDPKLTPIIEDLRVPEGTGRLLAVQVHGGLPPYTDTLGGGKIRIGRDCQPLTGTLRRKIAVETGETDFSAEVVAPVTSEVLSSAAMETLREAARLLQRPDREAREVMASIERDRGYVERGGMGRTAYWTLPPHLLAQLAPGAQGEREQRIAWEAAKTRVINVLRQRAARGEPGLSNAEARTITRLDRDKVKRLMGELRAEGARLTGSKRGARWVFAE